MSTASQLLAGSSNTQRFLKWSLGANEQGDWVDLSQYPDRAVQIQGTYGGATVVLQGSNDGSSGATLTDYDGNNISFTSGTNIRGVRENTRYVRPSVSGGSGTGVEIYLVGNGVR